jgi:hypothetical protein
MAYNTSMNEQPLLQKVEQVYTVRIVGEFTMITPKDDFSQPFRIREKDGVFIVSKGWTERVWEPLKWQKKKSCATMNEVYDYLIKDWNKSAKIAGMSRTPI